MSAGRSPIRVVHLINHLGYGGSERQLYLVLKHFDPARFEHRVVVFNPSAHRVYDAALAALGVVVTPLPSNCRCAARRLLFLAGRLRRWRPQIVHSWTLHDNLYAALAGRWSGAPVRWGSARLSLLSDGFLEIPAVLRFLSLRSVQRLVVNCRALVDQLHSRGYPPERILLAPNCVELPDGRENSDLSALGLGADEPLVGIVGNLRRRKNHGFFVRAMSRVLATRPSARALIVGQSIASEPEYREEVESEIARLGLTEKVILTGFRDDVPKLLERLSVVCLTSHYEGMPNVVLEAMAAGRPVVACRVDGVSELVADGVNGLVVEPGDDEGFAAAVGRLLDRPDLAAAMGRAGRERAAAEFGCGAAARRLEQAYDNALAEQRS